MPGPLARFNKSRYAFHSPKLHPRVEQAIHAMSIEENRVLFAPVRMEEALGVAPEQLTQLFVSGSHRGIGGGDQSEKKHAVGVLEWMLEEIVRRRDGIAFRSDVALEQPESSHRRLKKRPLGYRVVYKAFGTRKIQTISELYGSVTGSYQELPTWRPRVLSFLETQAPHEGAPTSASALMKL